jgi:hypothetical protein
MFANLRQKKGLQAKMVKLSHWDLISGTLLEMGVDINRGRQWDGTDEVMVVLGCYICKCNVGEGAENQNGKIEPLGLDFGRTIENGGGRSVGGGGAVAQMRWW